MDKPVVLIADCEADFRLALDRALSDRYRVHTCGAGLDALELLRQLHPDALVLDLLLPELDGLTLLQLAGKEALPQTVLAVTSTISPYAAESAVRLGVDYIMLKPCSPQAVSMRLADLEAYGHESDLRACISGTLSSLGFAMGHKGSAALIEAILLILRNPSQSMTKELYPETGKRCDPPASTVQVERSIRYAIDKAWDNREPEVWLRYFPPARRPTNRTFILRIGEAVKSTWQALLARK